MRYDSREPSAALPDSDDAPIGIVALWRLMRRNLLRIVLPAVVLTLLAVILLLRSEDVYSAEAQLLLTRGNLEIIEFDSPADLDVNRDAIANALTIFASRTIALDVVERLDLTNDPEINPALAEAEPGEADAVHSDAELRQMALDWLSEVTQIASVPDTNVIVVRAVTTDPQKSAEVANAYADAYLDYQRQMGQSETERAADALATRVSELRLRLEEDQEALQTYLANAPVMTTEGTESLANEASSIRSRLQVTEETLASLDRALAAMNGATRADLVSLRGLIDADETLARIEQSALDRTIGGESFGGDLRILQQAVSAERQRLNRLRDALQRGRETIEARVAEANEFSVGQRQLEVELETTSQVYEASLARLKQLSIQSQLRDAGAQILTRAEAPLEPSAQGGRRTVAIAGVLGLFLGVAYVLLREAANDRVRRASDLADAAGTDVVVQIPSAPSGFDEPGASAKGAASPFFEGVRALRHQLLSLSGKPGGPMAVGLFSALPDEGTSEVTRALAQSFAKIGKRVVVVDGNMRTGTLSRAYAVPAEAPGLRNVIAGEIDLAKAIRTLSEAGIDLLPDGRSDDNPADLLESPRFGDLVATLRDRYDVVLLDTPPILVVPDAGKIALQLDRHVFLADNGRSPKPAVRDALAAMRDAGGGRPVVALYNSQEAFGRQYGLTERNYAPYVG